MDRVNIFIATTARGPSAQEAVGHYIIEYLHNGIPTTYPPPGKTTYLYREKATSRSMTVELLANAIYVLPFILDKYAKEEIASIEVWIDPEAEGPFVGKWYDRWIAEDWMTRAGKPVKDADKWKRMIDLMADIPQRFIFSAGHTSYRDLMVTDAERELFKHRTVEKYKKARLEAGV